MSTDWNGSVLYRSEQAKDKREQDGRPSWMRTLLVTSSDWLSMIPQVRTCFGVCWCVTILDLSVFFIQDLKCTAENIKDPLFHFFEREVNSYISVKYHNDI